MNDVYGRRFKQVQKCAEYIQKLKQGKKGKKTPFFLIPWICGLDQKTWILDCRRWSLFSFVLNWLYGQNMHISDSNFIFYNLCFVSQDLWEKARRKSCNFDVYTVFLGPRNRMLLYVFKIYLAETHSEIWYLCIMSSLYFIYLRI